MSRRSLAKLSVRSHLPLLKVAKSIYIYQSRQQSVCKQCLNLLLVVFLILAVGEKVLAVGGAAVGGAVKAGEAVGSKVIYAGSAVGSAMAGSAGYVYEKTKSAAQATAETTKSIVVIY